MRPFFRVLVRATTWDSNPWRNDRESLRTLLKTIRPPESCSQEALAEHLGADKETVKNWEGMRTVPRPAQTRAILAMQKGFTPLGLAIRPPV
jgi:DNA-binding XRE family transcriptional regulator